MPRKTITDVCGYSQSRLCSLVKALLGMSLFCLRCFSISPGFVLLPFSWALPGAQPCEPVGRALRPKQRAGPATTPCPSPSVILGQHLPQLVDLGSWRRAVILARRPRWSCDLAPPHRVALLLDPICLSSERRRIYWPQCATCPVFPDLCLPQQG